MLVLQSGDGKLAASEAVVGVKLEDVMAAGVRIKRFIHRTPLLQSRRLNELLGCELYVKPEFLQKTGSFKARGALNFTLTDDSKEVAFTTYSSGNHGQALAWAAARLGRPAVIFMPEDASPAKVAAVRGYGGDVQVLGLVADLSTTAIVQRIQGEG